MRQFPRALVLCLTIGLATVATTATTAVAALIQGSLPISGSRNTSQYTVVPPDAPLGTFGPYGWSYSYLFSFDGTTIKDKVAINFQYDPDIAFEQGFFTPLLQFIVEDIWNNKFSLRDNGTGTRYPLTVELSTAGPTFDQTVQVSAGFPGDASNMNHWFDDDEDGVFAHEFGHALGLFDEYIGGAIDHYPNPTLTNVGVMGLGARSFDPAMLSRYYEHFLTDMLALNPDGNFSLVAVPEPATWLLLAIGAAFLIARRTRR